MVIDAFKPLGNVSAESMVNAESAGQIGVLVGHLKKDELRQIGYKLLKIADSYISPNMAILSLHYYWAARGEYFYRWRDIDDFAMDEAIDSFQKQIGLSLNALSEFQNDQSLGFIPAHSGYRQMRIIEEKRGNLTLALELCKVAKEQGWSDSWDKHIARIEKKLEKITV